MIAAIRLLLPFAVRYWRGLVLALMAMGGEILTAVLAPIPIQRAIDQVIRPILASRQHVGNHQDHLRATELAQGVAEAHEYAHCG